jgi:hypothetical protein
MYQIADFDFFFGRGPKRMAAFSGGGLKTQFPVKVIKSFSRTTGLFQAIPGSPYRQDTATMYQIADFYIIFGRPDSLTASLGGGWKYDS